MALNRKGYFFTLTVLLLIVLVSFSLVALRDPGFSRDADVKNTRIVEIGRFIDAIEHDAQTALGIAAFRAFLALDEEMRLTNSYIPNLDLYLEELILNGTLNKESVELLEISSMGEWLTKTTRLADYLGVSLLLENQSIHAYQKDPWFVLVDYSARLIVTDTFTNARWNQSILITSELPITHFFDPLYTIETDQRYTQKINRLDSSFPGDLLNHIDQKGYIASNSSPSFIQRIQGNLTLPDDWLGIESLVNPQELAAVGITKNTTLIDWFYFTDHPSPHCQVAGLPSWLLIDTQHDWLYGVTC